MDTNGRNGKCGKKKTLGSALPLLPAQDPSPQGKTPGWGPVPDPSLPEQNRVCSVGPTVLPWARREPWGSPGGGSRLLWSLHCALGGTCLVSVARRVPARSVSCDTSVWPPSAARGASAGLPAHQLCTGSLEGPRPAWPWSCGGRCLSRGTKV